MSRGPAGGLTYTVLASSTANGVAWPWLSLSPPIARPQIVTVERSFLPFLHLPGLVGVDGGVLFLLGLHHPPLIYTCLLFLACILLHVPWILVIVDLWLIQTHPSPLT